MLCCLRGDPLGDWPFAAAMIQPARRLDVFGFGHRLHFVCSMRQLPRPANLMTAAWTCRHSSLLAASFLACTIPADLTRVLGSSGSSSNRLPDADRIASLRSQRDRYRDNMSDSLPRAIIPLRIHPTFPSPLHGPSPPKGNDSTTKLHVKLARLNPASIATLLMAKLILQSLFKRATSR